MGNLLVHGKSIGDPGPIIGTTKHLQHKKVVKGGTTYHIHDTRGIGDSTTNEKELEKDLREFYAGHRDKCMVILCIRMDDRITDNGIKQCFEVCHSLGEDVWNNVIVAITHSEIPLEMRNSDNISEELEKLKKKWRCKVQKKAEYFEIGTKVSVCFTSHTAAEQPIDENWHCNLLETLFNKAKESNSCCQYVLNNLYAAYREITATTVGTETSEDSLTQCEGSLQNIGNDEEWFTKIADDVVKATSGKEKWIIGSTAVGAMIGGAVATTATAAGSNLAATAGIIVGGAAVGAAVGAVGMVAMLVFWLWIKRNPKSKED